MSMNSFHARQKKPRPAPQPAHERPAGMLRADALLVTQKLALPHGGAMDDQIRTRQLGRWHDQQPALELPEDTPLTVAADPDAHFVSRGGNKLAGALAIPG
jgi:23S rRNA (cytidine1920-2'-O)/16S rRNA (cytidine1409-2'-O)-methyltransferase